MTVRAALGAGTSRLRKLLLAGSRVAVVAVLGLFVRSPAWGTPSLSRFVVLELFTAGEHAPVDWMVLAFTAALAVTIALLLSFAPRVGTENSLGAGLAAGSTKTSGSGRRKRLQQALVITQVAMSVVLLSGAGLLVRSMQRLAAVDPGLNPQNVLTMEVPVDFTSPDAAAAPQRFEEMQRELSTLPGVEVVGVGSNVPLRSSGFQLEIKAESRVSGDGVSPTSEYRTADAELLQGERHPVGSRDRDFTDGESCSQHADGRHPEPDAR